MSHHRPPLPPRIEGGRYLAIRPIVAILADRHPDQVRRHCEPVACDVSTRYLLYDADEVSRTLAALRRRVA